MIDGFFVIDGHCHIYPEKIAEKAVGGTDGFYGENSFGKGTLFDLVEKGRAVGIDRFVVQSVATTPKQVRSINDYIAREVAASDILTGLGTMQQDSGDQEAEAEYILSLGLHGVKLHPDIQNFKVDDPRAIRIYEACAKRNLPILMHTGDYRYDNSNPNRLKPILKDFPDLTVIGAHFGGWSIWEKAAEAYAGTPNFYVDCSSSFRVKKKDTFYLTKKKAKEIIRAYGADRVLFGTDYPMWDPAKVTEFFRELNLDGEEYRKIYAENAKKVFRI